MEQTMVASSRRLDPITFEVLRNLYRSICNEASALIERVSYAPTITEGHDYSVSILTPDGRLVLGLTHLSRFGLFGRPVSETAFRTALT